MSNIYKADLRSGALDGASLGISSSTGMIALMFLFRDSFGSDFEFKIAAGILSSAPFLGMFLTPFVQGFISHFPPTKLKTITRGLTLLAALLLFLAGLQESGLYFAVFAGLSSALIPLRLPFQTAIYHDGYAEHERGKKHAHSLFLFQLSTIIIAAIGSFVIENRTPLEFRLFLIFVSFMLLVSSFVQKDFPNTTTQKSDRGITKSIFAPLRWLIIDKQFSFILLIWFTFGFANLWAIPLRFTVLEDVHQLDSIAVFIVATLIPEGARLLFLPAWARVFDSINFIVMRMILNVFLGAGLLLYFLSPHWIGVAIGGFLNGIGYSGGRLMWGLWVTKFTPQDRSQDYMALHVMLTGIRGLLGPSIGLLTLTYFKNDYSVIGLGSGALFFISILMLATLLPKKNA
jgi:hypothetical protein